MVEMLLEWSLVRCCEVWVDARMFAVDEALGVDGNGEDSFVEIGCEKMTSFKIIV